MAQRPTLQPRLVDARGRVQLPKEVLEHLGIGEPSFVSFELEEDGVRLFKVAWVPTKTGKR